MDRPIAPNEAAIVRWLLNNAPVRDVTPYFAAPPEGLRVVGGCDSGCTSLFFQHRPYEAETVMIADAVAVYPDGQQAGLLLWGAEGKIVWLEVHDCHPDSSHRTPEIANLRIWEHLFQE